MENVTDLKNERMHKLRSADDIVKKSQTDDRELTDEERATIKSLRTEVTAFEDKIRSLEDNELIVRQVAQDVDNILKPEERLTTPAQPQIPGTAPAIEMATGSRYGKMEAFKEGREGEEAAYRSGMWLRATMFGDPVARRWCVEHGLEMRVMTEGVNPAGGVLVPNEMNQAIIDLRQTYGVFRQECDLEPMAESVMTVPRQTGDMTASFVAEGGTATETDMAWDQVQLTARKLKAVTRVSSELAEDAIIDLGDRVAKNMAWAFAKKEDECGFIGTGAAAYGSIWGITIKIVDGNHAAGLVTAAANHDTFGELDAADIGSVMGQLPDYAHDGAKFYCSRVCKEMVFGRLLAAGGGNTIAMLGGATGANYLGYPIVTSPLLPAGATTDYSAKLMLIFGNLRLGSVMGERRGITVGTTVERYWEYDQIGIKGTERFDIVNHGLGDGTDAGPIVALKGH